MHYLFPIESRLLRTYASQPKFTVRGQAGRLLEPDLWREAANPNGWTEKECWRWTRISWLMPTDRPVAILRHLAESGHTVGALFHDARFAAICLENGVTTLWTADRDFSAYPQLRRQSPLSLA